MAGGDVPAFDDPLGRRPPFPAPERARRRSFGDGGTVVLALAAVAGAWWARPLPVLLGLSLGALAFVLGRPSVLVVATLLVASGLSAEAWSGLTVPATAPAAGVATLLTDPTDVAHGVRVEVRLHHRHLQAFAHGRAAGALRPLLAGDRAEVLGRLRPLDPRFAARAAVRHVGATLTIAQVGPRRPTPLVARAANGVRRLLQRSVASWPRGQQAMFAGFVLGDARGQPPATVAAFRASGLSHLLAVSGENVAFVLALASPLLRRLGVRMRLVAGLGVLGFFGLLTRWEPSVLRAEAMAVLVLLAALAGRPISTMRVLALAVTGLVLADPMLAHSVGFGLSVGACTGIALLAGPLSARLPLPVAVTLAAQVGVAPLLAPVFGGVPVASLPANLLAVPAAGPVMVWGMGAGVVTGALGGPIAALAQAPTRACVAWMETVAARTSALPLGQLGVAHLIALGGVGVLAVMVPPWRRVAVAAAVAICLLPATALAAAR